MEQSKIIVISIVSILFLLLFTLVWVETDAKTKKSKVRASISLSLGKETVSGQEKIKIYGTVTPAKSGVKVSIQKRVGKKKKYKSYTSSQTDASGNYSVYTNSDSRIKSIQVKAKVSKKSVSRKTNYNLDTMTSLYSSSNSNSNSNDNSNSSSDLAACGSQTEWLTAYPIMPHDTTNIVPLGNVNPSGHVFPTDHIYYYITKSEPGNPNSAPIEVPLYSPGNLRITSIDVSENVTDGYSDYSLTFQPCDEISFKYSHITTLAQKFLDQITPPYTNDNTYTTGGKTYHLYKKTVAMDITSGEEIGTAGGRAEQNALDFYAYDELASLTFANASRWTNSNSRYTACPIDYYSADKKAVMQAKLGNESYQRTTEPVCGKIDQDIAGTAKGHWFYPGSPNTPEDPHVALIDYNVNPNYQTISMGTSMSASGMSSGSYNFTPQNSGSVDLDFALVNTGSGVVCYDYTTGSKMLAELTSATTLRLEKQAGACGSGPWSFGATYTDFER